MKRINLLDESVFATGGGLWSGKKGPFTSAIVIRNTNFTVSGCVDYSDVAVLQVEQKQLTSRRLMPGDIIIERSGGGPKQPVGRVVFFERDDDVFSHSNFTTRLRVVDTNRFEPRFVFYFLLYFHDSGQTDHLQRRTTGIRNLDWKAYRESAGIPLFSLEEQRQIAAVLSAVQRAIERQERLIALTAELKKALMHKLFTEGTRSEALKQTEIGPVPESWEVLTLGELCKKPTGRIQTGPFGSILHKSEYQEVGTPIINPVHLVGNQIDHTNVPRIGEVAADRLHRYRLKENDLLFGRRGDIGRHGIVTKSEVGWFCGTGCFIVRLSDSRINPFFLNAYISKDEVVDWLEGHAAGVIMANLSNKVLERMPVCFPSMEEQTAIATVLDNIDLKGSVHRHIAAGLRALFRALLHQLMTAQIRVHDLDVSALDTICSLMIRAKEKV